MLQSAVCVPQKRQPFFPSKIHAVVVCVLFVCVRVSACVVWVSVCVRVCVFACGEGESVVKCVNLVICVLYHYPVSFMIGPFVSNMFINVRFLVVKRAYISFIKQNALWLCMPSL